MNNTTKYSECPVRIISWNMKGLSGAVPYASELLTSCDICVLTEHHLYECELYRLGNISPDVDVYGKSCNILNDRSVYTSPRYGGVAILWRSSLSHAISKCHNLGDDRICVVKLKTSSGALLFIIAVYLPQQNCYISNFQEITDKLESNGYTSHLQHAIHLP